MLSLCKLLHIVRTVILPKNLSILSKISIFIFSIYRLYTPFQINKIVVQIILRKALILREHGTCILHVYNARTSPISRNKFVSNVELFLPLYHSA
jgi:hypothetical protein